MKSSPFPPDPPANLPIFRCGISWRKPSGNGKASNPEWRSGLGGGGGGGVSELGGGQGEFPDQWWDQNMSNYGALWWRSVNHGYCRT